MPVVDSLFAHLMGIIQPQTCPSCGYFFSGIGLCKPCFFGLKRRLPPLCKFCGRNIGADDICAQCALNHTNMPNLWSVFPYKPLAIHCLGAAKSIGSPNHLKKLLGHSDVELTLRTIPTVDIVVPAPERWGSYRQRGFSTSRLIANYIGASLKVPVKHNLLTWTTAGQRLNRQVGHRKAERTKRLKGMMEMKAHVQGSVLLVDDVYTTGSTICEATRVARKNGASKVYAFCLTYQERNEGHSFVGADCLSK